MKDTHEEAHVAMDRLDAAETIPVEGSETGEQRVRGVRIQDGEGSTAYSTEDGSTTMRRGRGRVAVTTTLRVGLRRHAVRAEVIGERDAPFLTVQQVTKARGDEETVVIGPEGADLAGRALSSAAKALTQAAFRLP